MLWGECTTLSTDHKEQAHGMKDLISHMPVSRNEKHEQAAGWFRVRYDTLLRSCGRTPCCRPVEGPSATLLLECQRECLVGQAKARVSITGEIATSARTCCSFWERGDVGNWKR